MTQEALKLALEFVESVHDGEWGSSTNRNELVAAIKKALAQPVQEPVAWMYQEYRDDDQFGWRDEILFTPPPNDPIYFRNITPVYTHPPQRTWVGLTDQDWKEIEDMPDTFDQGVAWAQAKLKEKNT